MNRKEDLYFIYMVLGTLILGAVCILLILTLLDLGQEYIVWLRRTTFIK